jgi:phenylalanine-4-hydroxylase
MVNKDQKPTYTGDIAQVDVDPTKEYAEKNQEIAFSSEQHAIWADLYASIHLPYLMEHLCHEFSDGLALLQLDPRHIPTLAHLNDHIQPHTGWHIERTVVRYTMADDWYQKFARRIFLITDYLRTRDQMEFTPEPDMFHDIFGHLPYLTQKFYAHIEDKFAPAYLKATQEEREVIKRLAWYSTEFGLVIEGNRFKVFGAGTISGRAELTNTIMEFYRLGRDRVIDYTANIYPQLQEQYFKHVELIDRLTAGINELHHQGQMSSQDKGWNVVKGLYRRLGIEHTGYMGGDVILAPFEIDTIAKIPKTVYAFNPIFFVCETFEQMDRLLDSYLKPIAARTNAEIPAGEKPRR